MAYLHPPQHRGDFARVQCDYCYNLGKRRQAEYNRDMAKKPEGERFCSRLCSQLFNKSNRTPDFNCLQCGVLTPANGDARKQFCSSTCSARRNNRARNPAVYRKQSESLRKSGKAVEFGKRAHIEAQQKYEINPNLCESCGNPKSWKRRHRKTCGAACFKAALASPERCAKISAARKKRFADGSLKVTGGNTKWYDYKDIRVQGTYELRACHILDAWKDSGRIIDWEYTNDRVPYTNVDGRESTYLLDFKVWDQAGVHYIETKGYATDNDALKWAAARAEGLCVNVWFEREIELNELNCITA